MDAWNFYPSHISLVLTLQDKLRYAFKPSVMRALQRIRANESE
jgi:hypothetical protein